MRSAPLTLCYRRWLKAQNRNKVAFRFKDVLQEDRRDESRKRSRRDKSHLEKSDNSEAEQSDQDIRKRKIHALTSATGKPEGNPARKDTDTSRAHDETNPDEPDNVNGGEETRAATPKESDTKVQEDPGSANPLGESPTGGIRDERSGLNVYYKCSRYTSYISTALFVHLLLCQLVWTTKWSF